MANVKDEMELKSAPAEEEELQKKDVFLVSVGWCLGYAAFFIQVTTTSAKAVDLKGTNLSTVPLGVMLFATWISSFLIPKLLERFGNKIVYVIIALGGAVGAALCLVGNEAINNEDTAFALLVIGSMPQGIAHASTNSYRFAATQFAPPSKAPLAISLVIFGGVLSAVIGPEVSKYTRESVGAEFTGSYILLTAIWTAQALVALFPAFKPPAPRTTHAAAQQEEGAVSAAPPAQASVSVMKLLRRKKYLFGIFGGAVSFGAMAGLMAGTPVSMKDQGFSFDVSTTTVELHVVGMFAPAIFTGKVVAFLGVVPTVAAGLGLLLFGAVLLYISVTEATVYMVGLTIIGVGWNWSTVASTALITKSYAKHEAPTAQGLADGIIIGFLTIAVFTVGFMYNGFGKDWRLFVTFYVAITTPAVLAAIYYWFVGLEPPSDAATSSSPDARSTTTPPSPPAAEPLGKPEPKAAAREAVLSPDALVPAFAAQPPPGFNHPFHLVPLATPGQPYGLTPQHMVFQSQQQHQYPAGYLFNGSA